MSKAKKIALGVAMILAALGGAVVALTDDDPETTVDPAAVVQQVKEGVATIREATDGADEDVVAADVDTGSSATDTSDESDQTTTTVNSK